MMQMIRLSEEALMAALELLGCQEELGLPRLPRNGNEAMQTFLKGRDELCEKGFAELDFDGTICQTKEFARMMYTLPRFSSCTILRKDNKKEWYLRGPVELLHIVQEGKEYILERCRFFSFMTCMKDIAAKAEKGYMITFCGDSRMEMDLAYSEPETMDRVKEIAKHMCVFFEKEVPNA